MAAGGFETPTPSLGTPMNKMTPEQFQAYKADREMMQRNRYLSDEELEGMLPGESEGYKIVDPPGGYKPIRTPARKLVGTPTPGMTPGYQMPSENPEGIAAYGVNKQLEGLPEIREEDMEHFGSLLSVRTPPPRARSFLSPAMPIAVLPIDPCVPAMPVVTSPIDPCVPGSCEPLSPPAYHAYRSLCAWLV